LLLQYDVKNILSAIDRMSKYSAYSKLRYCNQISLLHFLVNPKNEDYLKVFLKEEDDKAVFSRLNSVKTKYKGIQAELKDIYIDMYPSIEDGEKYYKRNQYGIMKFFEEIITSAQSRNLDLCGRWFTRENKHGEPAIFSEYITYLQDKFGKGDGVINMRLLVDFSNWIDFINERMRDEYELTSFFYSENKFEEED
jgi:hypothetical protein